MRRLIRLGLVLFVALTVVSRWHTFTAVGRWLDRLSPWWLVVALVAELVSYLASAELQHRLLMSVGVAVDRPFLVELSYASSALSALLPAGAVVATGYTYRRLRRRGGGSAAVGWMLVASAVLSTVALVLLGLVGAGLRGIGLFCSVLGWLIVVLIAAADIGALASLAWASRERSRLDRIGRLVQRMAGRARRLVPGRTPPGALEQAWELEPVSMTAAGWFAVVTAASTNWVADGAVLGLAFAALRFPIPWQGLAFAYVITQAACTLPVGFVGLVEGSLTLALVCIGVPVDRALAVVLVYRLVSFWSTLPLGWVAARRLRATEVLDRSWLGFLS